MSSLKHSEFLTYSHILHLPLNFNNIYTQTDKTAILSRKPIYKHGNSKQFLCLYYIPHTSTTFSGKTLYLSAKIPNISSPLTFTFYTITETPDFCLIVYFCVIVRFPPQSPCYQRHQKTPKREAHQPLRWTPLRSKTLNFKPFSNPSACEYPNPYGINWK